MIETCTIPSCLRFDGWMKVVSDVLESEFSDADKYWRYKTLQALVERRPGLYKKILAALYEQNPHRGCRL